MSLSWVEDLLPEGFVKKRMFGGSAYYLDGKLVLVEFESEGNKEYRGIKYDFEIWNGCMFPVEKENHPAVLAKFPFLITHPVLPKWFYIPIETEGFENNVELILREIRRRNPSFGSTPKPKKIQVGSMDTRRPRMFSDEPAETALKKAQKISELKNLGPESEKTLLKAGIKTAPQLIKMGWKKAMIQLVKLDPRNNHSVFAYAVIGALQNKKWNLISEGEKAEARRFMKTLRQKTSSKTDSGRRKKRKSSR